MATLPPAGLLDQQRRPRAVRLVAQADWYLIGPGRFDLVGSGDVSEPDLRAVHREIGEGGVFVCVAKPPPLEQYLPKQPWRARRVSRTFQRAMPVRPKLRWVARGARLAVLPDAGTVWVDGEHLFPVGEPVPLTWTDPLVELVVVRPSSLYVTMKALVGTNGPNRASLP
jgi:hypothetical protein